MGGGFWGKIWAKGKMVGKIDLIGDDMEDMGGINHITKNFRTSVLEWIRLGMGSRFD